MNRKLIWGIARNELAALFYSPVAWLLLIAFAIHLGSAFGDILTIIVRAKALGQTINSVSYTHLRAHETG